MMKKKKYSLLLFSFATKFENVMKFKKYSSWEFEKYIC